MSKFNWNARDMKWRCRIYKTTKTICGKKAVKEIKERKIRHTWNGNSFVHRMDFNLSVSHAV
jgi:hypothetical protein